MREAIQLETLAECPLCGNTRGLRRLLCVSDHESGTGDYPIELCPSCRLAFTNPRPTEASIPALYDTRSTSDFTPGGTGSVTQWLRDQVIDRYLARRLPEKPPGGRVDVLDFGCGDGALSIGMMRHARRRNVRVNLTAVDFHSMAPPRLAEFGEAAEYHDYWSWREKTDTYDAIFLRHVLEHHPAPARLLTELGSVLKPGGILHIEVPNRRSIWARVFGRHFFAYYVPRHMVHFDEASLATAIETGGLRVVALRRGHTPLIGRSLGYALDRDMDNLGVLGLLSYPVQVAVDMLAGRSTTLRASSTR